MDERQGGEWVAVDILETFLNTEYDGGLHDGSLALIPRGRGVYAERKNLNERAEKNLDGSVEGFRNFQSKKGKIEKRDASGKGVSLFDIKKNHAIVAW